MTIKASHTRIAAILQTAALQVGALSYVFIMLFKPRMLTAEMSGDVLVLPPLENTLVSIACMAVCGVVLARLTALRVPSDGPVLVAAVALPVTAAALAFVRNMFVPLYISIALGLAAVMQSFLLARKSRPDSNDALLSLAVSLFVAALVAHLPYALGVLHYICVFIVALVMSASGCAFCAMYMRERHRGAQGGPLEGQPAKARQAAKATKATKVAKAVQGTSLSKDGQALNASRSAILTRAVKAAQTASRTSASATSGTLSDKPHAITKDLLLAGLPCFFVGAVSGFSLGSSWNNAFFGGMGQSALPFLFGVAFGVAFVLAVRAIRVRRSSAHIIVFATIAPLGLAVILSLFGGFSTTLAYILAVASQFCFISLLWANLLLLERSIDYPGLTTCGHLCLFLLVFAMGMLSNLVFSIEDGRKLLVVIIFVFMVYLVVFARGKGGEDVAVAGVQGGSPGLVLNARCAELAARFGLSAREKELLPLLVVGMSASSIGSRLFISPQTVKSHRYRIYAKMGVDSHEELYNLFSHTPEA